MSRSFATVLVFASDSNPHYDFVLKLSPTDVYVRPNDLDAPGAQHEHIG